MWKKALWVYLGLYVLGGVYSFITFLIERVSAGTFEAVSVIMPLMMLLPVVVVAFELREKKVWFILILFSLLITAIPTAGIFNFNDFNLATVAKAMIFLPMIAALLYFGYKRLFKK